MTSTTIQPTDEKYKSHHGLLKHELLEIEQYIANQKPSILSYLTGNRIRITLVVVFDSYKKKRSTGYKHGMLGKCFGKVDYNLFIKSDSRFFINTH